MIFKTVLKYKIFEYCLDSIFVGISKLFIAHPSEPLKIYNLREDMYLSQIRLAGYIFWSCDILSIERLPNTAIGNIENYALRFHYKTTNVTIATPNPYYTLVAVDSDWVFIP